MSPDRTTAIDQSPKDNALSNDKSSNASGGSSITQTSGEYAFAASNALINNFSRSPFAKHDTGNKPRLSLNLANIRRTRFGPPTTSKPSNARSLFFIRSTSAPYTPGQIPITDENHSGKFAPEASNPPLPRISSRIGADDSLNNTMLDIKRRNVEIAFPKPKSVNVGNATTSRPKGYADAPPMRTFRASRKKHSRPSQLKHSRQTPRLEDFPS